ncbi:MAG: hypothetical protein J6N45_07785 [Alphaproteobacteria bacterium]|nr:hypothetical protein [Alphaproteobacteria bacterium]
MASKPLKYCWDNDKLIDLLARVSLAEGSLLSEVLHLPESTYAEMRADAQDKEFIGLNPDTAHRACEYGVVVDNIITLDALKYWNGCDLRNDCADEVAELLAFVNDEDLAHPHIRTAVAYAWFLNLQPFAENNDLTARYLMLAMFSKHEHLPKRFYAITEVFFEDESTYRQALETTLHGDKNLTEWVYFFLNSMLKAIQKSLLKYVRSVVGMAQKKVAENKE